MYEVTMAKLSKLSVENIYNKEFNIEFKGYSVVEVDAYLDEIIKDYQNFYDQLDKAYQTIKDLQHQNAILQAKAIDLQGRLDAQPMDNPNQQVDMLKRLARLEQEIFKK